MNISAQVPDSLVEKIDAFIAHNRTREITESPEDMREARRIAESQGAAAANIFLKERRAALKLKYPTNRHQFVLAAIEEKMIALELLPKPEESARRPGNKSPRQPIGSPLLIGGQNKPVKTQ